MCDTPHLRNPQTPRLPPPSTNNDWPLIFSVKPQTGFHCTDFVTHLAGVHAFQNFNHGSCTFIFLRMSWLNIYTKDEDNFMFCLKEAFNSIQLNTNVLFKCRTVSYRVCWQPREWMLSCNSLPHNLQSERWTFFCQPVTFVLGDKEAGDFWPWSIQHALIRGIDFISCVMENWWFML